MKRVSGLSWAILPNAPARQTQVQIDDWGATKDDAALDGFLGIRRPIRSAPAGANPNGQTTNQFAAAFSRFSSEL